MTRIIRSIAIASMLLAASVITAQGPGRAADPWQKASVLTVGKDGVCADLRTAIARAKGPTVIRFLPGKHILSRTLRIEKSDIMLTGDGGAEIVVRSFGAGQDGDVTRDDPAIWIGEPVQCSNIKIENLTFRFEKPARPAHTGGDILFYVRSVEGFTVEHCDIRGFDEAINLCYCGRVRIARCTLKNRIDITFAFGSDLTVVGNRLGRNVTAAEFKETSVEEPVIVRDNTVLGK